MGKVGPKGIKGEDPLKRFNCSNDQVLVFNGKKWLCYSLNKVGAIPHSGGKISGRVLAPNLRSYEALVVGNEKSNCNYLNRGKIIFNGNKFLGCNGQKWVQMGTLK